MKEDFLTHLWKFQKIKSGELFTTCGLSVHIFSPGLLNNDSGPDFFNARLSIGEQLWVGNVEIHVKSSMWYHHAHQLDTNYDSVILHVVWEHDAEIYRSDNTVIPTLELKHFVPPEKHMGNSNLLPGSYDWIPCEQELQNVPLHIKREWIQKLYFERLQEQTNNIKKELEHLKMNWEALLFRMLCRNFGMKVNRESFQSLSESLNYQVIKKCRTVKYNLEALLLGQAGLLEADSESNYLMKLQKEYAFIRHKFDLKNDGVIRPKFFRLRPANFPTIRLSQLAELYRLRGNLFSEIINSSSKEELYGIFDISASKYWDTHFSFGRSSGQNKKRLTEKFVDLVIINTIVPLQFCYGKYYDKELLHSSGNLLASISGEENYIVQNFTKLSLCASSAAESQAMIQLYNHYCNKLRCIDCSIGNYMIKGDLK